MSIDFVAENRNDVDTELVTAACEVFEGANTYYSDTINPLH